MESNSSSFFTLLSGCLILSLLVASLIGVPEYPFKVFIPGSIDGRYVSVTDRAVLLAFFPVFAGLVEAVHQDSLMVLASSSILSRSFWSMASALSRLLMFSSCISSSRTFMGRETMLPSSLMTFILFIDGLQFGLAEGDIDSMFLVFPKLLGRCIMLQELGNNGHFILLTLIIGGLVKVLWGNIGEYLLE